MFCERRSPVSSCHRDAEALADELLDPLDRDLRRLALWEDVLEDVLGEVDRAAAGP